jgi:hypothetical protein
VASNAREDDPYFVAADFRRGEKKAFSIQDAERFSGAGTPIRIFLSAP